MLKCSVLKLWLLKLCSVHLQTALSFLSMQLVILIEEWEVWVETKHGKYIGQYVLSVAFLVVQLILPPRGARQLCEPLAAPCGLSEQVYH